MDGGFCGFPKKIQLVVTFFYQKRLGKNNLPGWCFLLRAMVSEFAGTFLDLSFFNVMVYELHPMRNIITDTITPKSNPFI